MPTKVFISWSGELSRKLGEALRKWLPATLQFVKPYFSPDDIEKGAKWNSEIANELESSNIGVICLTQDNIEKPWILFESGALSKTLDKARVCTLLFNLDAADLKGPLTSFQATKFVREDFHRLVSTINNTAGDAKLETSVLENVFSMWWPKLEQEISDILKTHEKGTKRERRPERDILEEVLELTRMNAERAHRPSRISPPVVNALVDAITELSLIARQATGGRSPIVNDLIVGVDFPIRRLCLDAGCVDAYERYVSKIGDMSSDNQLALTEDEAEALDDKVRRARAGASRGIFWKPASRNAKD